MKYLILSLLFSPVFVIFTACSGNNKPAVKETVDEETVSIQGKWVLIKSEDSNSRKKNHQNQPSNVILDFQKNGFFIVYDTFVDPAWRKKGLPLIQKRASGQWKLQKSDLTMIYRDKDSTRTEKFKIVRCSEKELVTQRSGNKKTIYRTYGKK